MNWSIIGKLILRSLPGIIERVEHRGELGKKELALAIAHDELHEIAPEVATHPKVIEALGKANDALVEAHNVIAHVEADINAAKK